ncbi:hypothetical protein [Deinococcus multiflagellatus]|uniref:Uncharacterized protein n=1 Tax=Deinococcus multiflagellatus TaxID=1656887 RepID=A0ABW1ZIA7_9DEIO
MRVQLNSARSPLPPVRLDGVFVVGGEGLWKAPIRGAGTQATVWGRNAAGLQPGEPVQVVVRLLDDRGRVLWLRGAQTRVGQAPEEGGEGHLVWWRSGAVPVLCRAGADAQTGQCGT